MSEKRSQVIGLFNVDVERLARFSTRMLAGLGIVILWLMLLGASIVGIVYLFALVSGQEWFGYASALFFVPIGIFMWWICYFYSLELLSDIGVEINGGARIIVVPIAVPLALLLFILGFFATAGEAIQTKAILRLSFLVGAAALVAIVYALSSP